MLDNDALDNDALDNDALDNDALDNDALDNDAVAPRKPGSSRAAGQVGDFHRAYGLQVRDSPTVAVGADQVELRLALIEEEVGELAEAARAADLIGVADALADIVYVAYGTAHVYGIDLDAVLDEVHASNMTKLGADGKPIRRADGKVLKGPAYRPPNIADVLLPPVPQVPSAGSPGLPST